jgi:hypothetical protein
MYNLFQYDITNVNNFVKHTELKCNNKELRNCNFMHLYLFSKIQHFLVLCT